MAKTLVQVGVVLAAAVLVAIPLASASPLAGLGSFLGVGPRGTQAPPEDSNSNGGGGFGFPNPLQFPQKVLNTFSGGKQGQESQDGQDAAAPAPAQNNNQHHPHRVAPPKAAASTAAPARQPPPTTVAATTASTTTAAPTTAAPTAAKEVTTVVSRFASSDSPPSEQPAKSSGGLGNYTEEEIVKCREKWLEVTNSTISDNLDILSVLLENGGFPGQLDGNLKWERNATEGRPNRWTYFWGDSDYKTYIRVENGEVDRRAPPVQGTNPSALSGDIYWSPPDFCGKLRHAKYTQDPELRASNQPKVCFIDGERVICWSAPECVEPIEPGTTCPRGGVSGALMASLVG